MNCISYLVALVLLVHQSVSLESPCVKKNITLMSPSSFKPLVNPSTCGRAHLNESDVLHPPNVILHGSGTTYKNKYTIMLLMEKPNTHDVFSLKWLLSNISPLSNSLTANESRTEFLRYTPPKSNGTAKYWLLAFIQDSSAGLLPRGVTHDEIENFWPQKWVSRNDRYVKNLVGGVEFYVNKPKNIRHTTSRYPVYPQNTQQPPRQYYTTSRYPVYPHNTQQPPRQYYTTSRYPVYPHNTQQPPRQYYTTPRYPVYPQPPPSNTHFGPINMMGMNRTNNSYIPIGWHNNTRYNNSGYYPPNPGYPQPPHYPQQPPHYPQQPPPQYPPAGYHPPPSNVHNHYYDNGKKGKKGGASAVAGFVPLVAVLALAAIF